MSENQQRPSGGLNDRDAIAEMFGYKTPEERQAFLQRRDAGQMDVRPSVMGSFAQGAMSGASELTDQNLKARERAVMQDRYDGDADKAVVEEVRTTTFRHRRKATAAEIAREAEQDRGYEPEL